MNTNECCVGLIYVFLRVIINSGLGTLCAKKQCSDSTHVKHRYAVVIYFSVYYLFR